jgi:diketogulonate reductase-like aldo/keto reductase
METFNLASDRPVARLGQGTWRIGEHNARRVEEIAALRAGLDLGLAVIDTAEMYGDGRSEELIADAIAGRRGECYLVSKVLPHNATRRGTVAACERSLRRLRSDYLDLYLLHWRQAEPLDATLEAFVELRAAGKIRHYGVSNFDVDDLEDARALAGGDGIAANQVLYSLEHRGIEWDLLPWCRRRSLPVMAYSPLGSSPSAVRRLLATKTLRAIAQRHEASAAAVALAWVLRDEQIVVVPKAATVEHVRDNRRALDLDLSQDDLRELDMAFPPPSGKTSLAMI